MMFDKRNYALSSWRNVVKVLSPWRRVATIGSIALILAACEEYSQRFEEEYEFGPSENYATSFDGNSMTDYRDNITYSVRRVGNVWWMMDDLAHPFYTDDAYKETYCYKDREETCDEIGRLYPGEYLDYACPKGWRFPSLEEWTEFFNSKVFREYTPRHNGASDLYKGYVDGEHVLNGYGEDAYYWTNSHYFSDSYIDCVHYKRNTSSSGGIEPDYSSLSTAELCHEQWKLAVRCVLDAGSAGPEQNIDDVSSLEVNLEEVCAMGLNEQCLVGTWNLKGIESIDGSQMWLSYGTSPSTLVITDDGKFEFTFTTSNVSAMAASGCGGTKTYGSWEILGASLKIEIGRSDCLIMGQSYTLTPTLSVTNLNLNKVVFHEHDMTDALTKANSTENFVRVK